MLDLVMTSFTPVASTLGGVLLGLAASSLFFFNGRILGITGIVGGLPSAPARERVWRIVFLAGLLTGGVAVALVHPDALPSSTGSSIPVALVAGALVGLGTRLSNGCTSGHGLCGLARRSPRSLVATLVFMATGALTVALVRHVFHLGGAS